MSPPFAVLLLPDGTTRSVAVQSRTESSPPVVELVDGLVRNLRERATPDEFRAVAVCATGYVARADTGERARAILIGLEAPGRAPESMAVPYSRGLYGSYAFHPVVRQAGKCVVFTSGADKPEAEG
jgi:hypothetical protein